MVDIVIIWDNNETISWIIIQLKKKAYWEWGNDRQFTFVYHLSWLFIYLKSFGNSKNMIKRVINHKLKLIKVNILGFYQDHIKQKLSPSQVITLQILLYVSIST